MTNWPGHPGPDGSRHDQPDAGGPHDQQTPPPRGTYRQPWANTPSTPPQAPGPGGGHPQAWGPPQGPSAQPWTQQPGPGGPPPGWQPPQSDFANPTPPKSRKKLLIALAAVVLVAAVAFVGYRVTTGEGIAGIGATPQLSPSETVQQYLDALAAGDAEKALSFGASQPASTDLLTDKILAEQNAEMPVRNIRILDEDNSGEMIGSARVHVAVNFGDVVDDVELPLKKDSEGVWKLENAAVKIDPPPGADSMDALDTVTLFDQNFDKGSLYVFPGYLDVGSTNDYLEVTTEPVLLQGLGAYSSSYLNPKIALNDDGRQAIEDQLAEAFANCQRSSQLDPPGCPTRVSAYDSRDAIDGTVSWGKADFGGIKIGDVSPFDMSVIISGQATMTLSFQTTDGGTRSGTVNTYVNAEADITTTPPTLEWR
ncbi:DUF4878 domain-containing protein [Mycolicibacterium moriokaense]|nr:DUF4878 domain-containing protein [Mycolicibacterium moriokaense]